MARRRYRLRLIGGWLAIVGTGSFGAQQSPDDAIAFLRHNWRFSAEEIRLLRQGEPVGKILDASQDDEIAILGAIRLGRSKEEFVEWYRNVENFKQSPLVVEVGLVGNPPAPAAFSRLTLDENELKSIRNCRPGLCPLKLDPREIEQFLAGLDWVAPAAAGQASALARQMLLSYVEDYWKRGNAALGFYEDKQVRVERAAVFRALLDASPWLRESFPGLFQELREYGGTRPGVTDDFIYWSRERYGFGLKPLLNLCHVTIRQPKPAVVVISSKQIRSTHYFDGSLGLIVAIDAPDSTAGSKECYMIYVNRSRVDLLRGGFWGWKRKLFARRLPGEIRKQLVLIKSGVQGRANRP